MRAPYLALTWPADCESSAAAASAATALAKAGWSKAWERPGLCLWGRRDRPLTMAAAGPEAPLIVGRRFGAAGYARATGGQGRRAPADGARALCRDGWGGYVALLQDPADGRWWAFRDPSGAMEAFTWSAGPLGVLCSGLDQVPAGVLPLRLALDWDGVADFLRRPVAQIGRPALRGFEAVAAGDVQPIGAPPTQAVAIWRPRDWIPTRAEVDPQWPGRLAQTVQETVSALVGPYGRINTEASGGLDSSIVNAALARAGLAPRVAAALHYVGDRREADERAWAADLCARWGLPLVCSDLGLAPFDPDRDFAELSRGVRPPCAVLDAHRDRDAAARLQSLGAQALVTGHGGDAVFFQMPTARVLSDLWRAHGLAAAWRPRNAEIARRLRRSVWSVWREALRPASGAGDARPSIRGAASRDAAHPWLEDLSSLPPGKRLQIEALVSAHVSLGVQRCGQVADLIQPLLAQPVVELCLSIPSWELARGDQDRGLAREAFAAWLPETITARRSKGTLTSHYSRRVAASVDALRAHLLDGVLAEAGLLDRAAMEAALDPDQLIARADGLELMGVAAVESWVRYWQTRVPDAAEASRVRPVCSDV